FISLRSVVVRVSACTVVRIVKATCLLWYLSASELFGVATRSFGSLGLCILVFAVVFISFRVIRCCREGSLELLLVCCRIDRLWNYIVFTLARGRCRVSKQYSCQLHEHVRCLFLRLAAGCGD
ncbi:unnamed protein product, partial [Ectocarpus sp. 4 AP-2014]